MIKLNVRSNIAEHIKGTLELTAKRVRVLDNYIGIYNALDRYLVEHHGAKDELGKEHVLGFYDSKLKEGTGLSYMQKIVRALRDLSLFMQTKGLDAYYLAEPVLPPPKKKAYFIPTREQVAAFIKYLDKTASTRKSTGPGRAYCLTTAALIFRIVYLGGTRPGEACRLPINGIDYEQQRIYVHESKGAKSRYVYLPEGVMELLKRQEAYLKRLHPGQHLIYIFPKPKKLQSPFGESFLGTIIREFWFELFPELNDNFRPTPHTLRHAYCVHAIDRWNAEGIDVDSHLPYLSAQMGHSTLDDTLYYYHQIHASSQAIRSHLEQDNAVSKEFLNGI